MSEESKKQLAEVLASFDTGMLITRHGEGEHARPMAVAKLEGTRTLWFATSIASPKADEIRSDQRVAVTFQAGSKYAALSGRAQLVRDRAKIDELWKDTWKVWFPKGKEDPEVALIRVDVDDAEYWDNGGTKGIRYVVEAARAVLNGEKPKSIDAGQHGREKRA